MRVCLWVVLASLVIAATVLVVMRCLDASAIMAGMAPTLPLRTVEEVGAHTTPLPLCRVSKRDLERTSISEKTLPTCLGYKHSLFGSNPSVIDGQSMMLKFSPYNFCKTNAFTSTINNVLDIGSPSYRMQSVSVWTVNNVVEQVVYDSEDARLFLFRGVAHCVFSRLSRKGVSIASKMVLARLEDPYREVDLQYEGTGKVEKNWVVNSTGKDLYLSYSINPHVVLSVDVQTGECTKAYETTNPFLEKRASMGGIRGGSQFVRLDEHTLVCVVHRTRKVGRWPFRVYDHAFCLAEATPPFAIQQLGEWFCFPARYGDSRDAIQFCCGCAVEGSDLLLSYGVADCVGFIARISIEDAMRTFRTFPT